MSLYLTPRCYFRYNREVRSRDILPVCSSLDNFFIPIFAGIIGTIYEYKTRKVLVYNLKEPIESSPLPRTITRFLQYFHDGNYYIFRDTDINYFTHKHFVYVKKDDVIYPLYCLCTTRDEIFRINPNSELDFANSYLLINNNLLTDPTYRSMASKLKPLIKHFKDHGINMVYTNDIMKLCFSPPTEQKSFATFGERMEFINNIKKQLNLYDSAKEKITETAESITGEFANITSTDTQDLF